MSGEKTVSPLLVNVNGNKPSTEDHREAEHAQACGQRVGSPRGESQRDCMGKDNEDTRLRLVKTRDSVGPEGICPNGTNILWF